MAKFSIGDRVRIVGSSYIGKVIKIDEIIQPIPLYNVLIDDSCEIRLCYELSLCKLTMADDALRYGDVLTDDNLYCELQAEDGFEDWHYVRIRTIHYESHIFYHKMVDGEVVEFKELVT